MRKTISTSAVIIFLIMGACGSPEPENANDYALRGAHRGAQGGASGDMSGSIEDYSQEPLS